MATAMATTIIEATLLQVRFMAVVGKPAECARRKPGQAWTESTNLGYPVHIHGDEPGLRAISPPRRRTPGRQHDRAWLGVRLSAAGPGGHAPGRPRLWVIDVVASNIDVDSHLDRLDAHTMCDATPQERDDGRRKEKGASRLHRHSTWRAAASSATTKTLVARK
jgi:hypothetical protein